jgi:patched 1 protein
MAMFFFGCIGLYRSRIGLELADVLPENTAPAAFLKARERYFSFYPMFIVTRGEADIPKQQALIEKFRREIGSFISQL